MVDKNAMVRMATRRVGDDEWGPSYNVGTLGALADVDSEFTNALAVVFSNQYVSVLEVTVKMEDVGGVHEERYFVVREEED